MKSVLILNPSDTDSDSEGDHAFLAKENGSFCFPFLEVVFYNCNNQMLVLGLLTLWHVIDILGKNEVKDEKPKLTATKANGTKPEASDAKPKVKIVEPEKHNDKFDDSDESSEEEDSDEDEVCIFLSQYFEKGVNLLMHAGPHQVCLRPMGQAQVHWAHACGTWLF